MKIIRKKTPVDSENIHFSPRQTDSLVLTRDNEILISKTVLEVLLISHNPHQLGFESPTFIRHFEIDDFVKIPVLKLSHVSSRNFVKASHRWTNFLPLATTSEIQKRHLPPPQKKKTKIL